MIKLNFIITLIDYKNNNVIKKIKANKSYKESLTLKEIIISLNKNYNIVPDSELVLENSNLLFWNKYNFGDLIYNLDIDEKEYLSHQIIFLEEQFNISNLTINLINVVDGMGGTIGIYEGIRFFFHTNEKDLHHKPHIHCEYSGKETRIDLLTNKVMDIPLKKSKMKIIYNFIKINKTALLKIWDEIVIKGNSNYIIPKFIL